MNLPVLSLASIIPLGTGLHLSHAHPALSFGLMAFSAVLAGCALPRGRRFPARAGQPASRPMLMRRQVLLSQQRQRHQRRSQIDLAAAQSHREALIRQWS